MNYAKSPFPYSEIREVGPEMARAMLARNKSNRPITATRVAEWVRTIKSGRWHVCNQGIGVDPDGYLLDGQHRMAAIVQSGIAVPILFLFNMSKDAQAAVDLGKRRTAADALVINGVLGKVGSSKIVDVVNFLGRLLDLPYGTPQAIEDILPPFMDDAVAINQIITRPPVVSSAAIRAAFVFARPANPTRTDAFAVMVRDGENLSKNHPALTLRRYLLENQGNQKHAVKDRKTWEIKNALRTMAAIHAFIEDRKTLSQCRPSIRAFDFFAKHRLRLGHPVSSESLSWRTRVEDESK